MDKQKFIEYFISRYPTMAYDDYLDAADSHALKHHGLVFMRPHSDDYVQCYGYFYDDFYFKSAIVKHYEGKYIMVDYDEFFDEAYEKGWIPPTYLAVFEFDDNSPFDIMTDGAVKELHKVTIYDDYDGKDTVYGYGYLFDLAEIINP